MNPMKKKVAVIIDGGFLRVKANRAEKKYNNLFIQGFAHNCILKDEEELFKIFYYDAPPHKGTVKLPISRGEKNIESNNSWIQTLASLDYFAVRLGTTKFNGWEVKASAQGKRKEELTDDDYTPNITQKGVDIRIGLDIARLAHNRYVDRIAIVTGDTDLIPAMKYARIAGLQVIGIEFHKFTLSRELLAHVDIKRKAKLP